MVGRAAAICCALSAATLACAGTARADDQFSSCTDTGGPPEFQAALTPLFDAAQAAARQALGSQFISPSYDNANQGWEVFFSPGALDGDAARAAVVTAVDAAFPAAQAQYLTDHLRVVAQPYAEPDLEAVQAQVIAIMKGLSYASWAAGLGCENGLWRVGLTVYTGDADPTDAQRDEIAGLMAPFGDRVTYELRKGAIVPQVGVAPVTPSAPAPAAPMAAPRVASYVSLASPKHCVRGRTITVKARKAADLKSLAVSSRGHRTTLVPGHKARVRLAARGATKVSATVTLNSGATATQTYRFRRC
jgi:hypothetical protein